MKTTYYTFIVWNEGTMASGSDSAASGSRQCAMIRQQPEPVRRKESGKVIELDAWQADSREVARPQKPELALEEPDLTFEEPEPALEEPEEAEPVLPRPRRNHHWLRSLWSWLMS